MGQPGPDRSNAAGAGQETSARGKFGPDAALQPCGTKQIFFLFFR